MTDPAQLSHRLMDAFNRRDLAGLRALMADTVEYKFAGARTLTDPDKVIGRYRKIFATLGETKLKPVQMVSDGASWSAFIIENVAELPQPQIAVFHQWQDGKLQIYRAFADVQTSWAGSDKEAGK